MSEANNERNQMTENPQAAIREIIGQISVMGANDYEVKAVEDVLRRLDRGECTVDEAMNEAEAIRDGKQAYH